MRTTTPPPPPPPSSVPPTLFNSPGKLTLPGFTSRKENKYESSTVTNTMLLMQPPPPPPAKIVKYAITCPTFD